jgi:hypothetical protein
MKDLQNRKLGEEKLAGEQETEEENLTVVEGRKHL